MPIYEYECKQCGHRLETIQKMSDDPLKECPECKQPELKKLVSAAAFRLKGGGWYETDFKSGNKRNIVQSDNKSEKKSDSSGDKKGAGSAKSTSQSGVSTSSSKKSTS